MLVKQNKDVESFFIVNSPIKYFSQFLFTLTKYIRALTSLLCSTLESSFQSQNPGSILHVDLAKSKIPTIITPNPNQTKPQPYKYNDTNINIFYYYGNLLVISTNY